MAGLTSDTPAPQSITLHGASRVLEIGFSDGSLFRIPFELMRIYSPSAEVQGHGPGQEVLQVGKKDVEITAIEPVGTYAINLTFSDGHDSGIYSWTYLYDLGVNQAGLWEDYLQRMKAAGASREPVTTSPIPIRPKSK